MELEFGISITWALALRILYKDTVEGFCCDAMYFMLLENLFGILQLAIVPPNIIIANFTIASPLYNHVTCIFKRTERFTIGFVASLLTMPFHKN